MSSRPGDTEAERASALFDARFDANVRRTDRLFAGLMAAQWIFGIGLALVISPLAWAGKTHVLHEHVYLAIFGGGLLSSLPIALAIFRPGWFATRVVIASAQMLWSGLLIHLSGGRIETHFHVFGSLAFLAFYRDWRVFVPATIVVAADHMARQFLWPESVFGVLAPEPWRFLEHAGWVLFEDVFLIISCVGSQREMKEAAAQQTHIEFTERLEKESLEKELEIASRIQTSVLPRFTRVRGLECAAKMITALAVGGDYYDIVPVADGCWIGIGDVAGHGLAAGLVMLQAQSAIEALVHSQPNAEPRHLLQAVNRVLHENVRRRLRSDEHVTLSLIRYYDDGRFVAAGAHEDVLVWRQGTGRCERVRVRGTWLGIVEDISAATVETTMTLAPGDLLVLYTDGVIECRNRMNQLFEIDRLAAIVEAHASASADELRDRVIDAVTAWSSGEFSDDVTVFVVRHVGVELGREATERPHALGPAQC